MKLNRPALFTLALAACVLSTPVSAQWKWRDAQGKVQYSDLPPPQSVPDRDVLKRPAGMATSAGPAAAAASSAAPAAEAAASAPAKAEAAGLDKEVEARRRAEEQAAQATRKAEEQRLARERAEYCTQARGHLRALESGGRLTRTNANGEREFLDDTQRTQEIAQTRKGLATHCK